MMSCFDEDTFKLNVPFHLGVLRSQHDLRMDRSPSSNDRKSTLKKGIGRSRSHTRRNDFERDLPLQNSPTKKDIEGSTIPLDVIKGKQVNHKVKNVNTKKNINVSGKICEIQ
ncbi:unnamed protein product [Didymodactylos carnosus]|uniref:Uncharacterized protein n=1 Tax=Didymodactylos carnosus TaxID=1234261 RepID=A0A815P1K6_9BILA|nr:unnamed protein product [Didymodactylos carnosus]CAF4317569.1 unnamed protein product [Didymodactylos carnosus]